MMALRSSSPRQNSRYAARHVRVDETLLPRCRIAFCIGCMYRASPDRGRFDVHDDGWCRDAAAPAATASSSAACAAVRGDASVFAAAADPGRAAWNGHDDNASARYSEHAGRSGHRDADHAGPEGAFGPRDVFFRQRLQSRCRLLRRMQLPRAPQGRLATEVRGRQDRVVRDGSVQRQARGLFRGQMRPLRRTVDVKGEKARKGSASLRRAQLRPRSTLTPGRTTRAASIRSRCAIAASTVASSQASPTS